MPQNPGTVVPQEVEAVLKTMYGEVIPLTDEEKVFWIINLHQIISGRPHKVILPKPIDMRTYLTAFNSQLPEAKRKNPNIIFNLPEIPIPTSAFCFFKEEWAKKKHIKFPDGVEERGTEKNRKNDPHTIIWNGLTEHQKENWIAMFEYRRDVAKALIRGGFCTKKPSLREKKKAERLGKKKAERVSKKPAGI